MWGQPPPAVRRSEAPLALGRRQRDSLVSSRVWPSENLGGVILRSYPRFDRRQAGLRPAGQPRRLSLHELSLWRISPFRLIFCKPLRFPRSPLERTGSSAGSASKGGVLPCALSGIISATIFVSPEMNRVGTAAPSGSLRAGSGCPAEQGSAILAAARRVKAWDSIRPGAPKESLNLCHR